jgi:hypothetical protein
VVGWRLGCNCCLDDASRRSSQRVLSLQLRNAPLGRYFLLSFCLVPRRLNPIILPVSALPRLRSIRDLNPAITTS